MGQVDRKPRRFKVFPFEAVEHRFERFDPGIAVVHGDAFVTQGQAEQLAIEQAHQTIDIGLGELFAQARIAVVVCMVQLLPDRLEALFQVAQTLVEILAGELARLGERASKLIVSILGGEQLLLEYVGILDQRKAVLQRRELT